MRVQGVISVIRIAVLAAAAALPLCSQAADGMPASTAELRNARSWLLPQWDDKKEEALQSREAAAAGPGYYTTPLRVPGSDRRYTRNQINSQPPDWWPQEHPPMPPVVGIGKDKASPCAGCHLPDGAGTAANAALAGLPEPYLLEQVNAFGSGARTNSEMHTESLAVSDADLRIAVAYYAGLHLSGPRARLIEAGQVPVTHVETWMLVPTPDAGTEALGNRIIEVPENVEQAKLGDSHARFIAYVPPGSIEGGKRLATTGDGRTQPCVVCHGTGLHGTAVAPPLAGRSPTYLARQLVEFATGDRNGPANAAMQGMVSHLSLADMIAVAAYAASLPP